MRTCSPKLIWSSVSLVALVFVLAACAEDVGPTGIASAEEQAATPSTVTTIVEPAVPSSTTVTVVEDPVLVAYGAFWDLYIELGGAPPPFDPDAVAARLDELTTGAETEHLFGFFQNNATTGLVLRGDSDHATKVVSTDGQLAVVEDCVDDRVGVYRADGSRVDTDIPDRRLYRTALRLVDGSWKVERVESDGIACTA